MSALTWLFLQRQGALKYNPVIDTRELASVLMPTLSRYNLATLGIESRPSNRNPHRALDDALLTASVFQELANLAHKLPLELLTEIVQLARGLDWDGRFFFTEVLRDRSKQPSPRPKKAGRRSGFAVQNPHGVSLPPSNPIYRNAIAE